MLNSLIAIAGIALAGGIALFAIGLFISRLYKRASQETAFVRTGFGGSKVIVEGGALVLPVLHDMTEVSLKTHKLEVQRAGTSALITQDSLRADVTVEFFVRVMKEAESIKIAAQTLGRLTNDPTELKKLVEGKFVDALRSVAAGMDLSQLHQNRSDFVQKVRSAASEDLLKNGLELESASLVGLDQTDQKHFNPDNTFDAAGLAKISQITEAKRKERFDIVQTTEVAIAERTKEARMKTLNIELDTKNAELQQAQQIAESTAKMQANVAAQDAESKKNSEQARINADREIAEAEVRKNLAIDLAKQESETKVAEQSRTRSAAEAAAADERAKAVQAEERIETAKAVEIAERSRAVEVLEAQTEADKRAVGITTAAQAEMDSAVTRAEAIQTVAEAEAKAEITRASAKEKTYEVEAAGKAKVNEAENLLSERIIEMNIRLRTIDVLPQIIEQSVKPLNNIESIRIVDVGGLNGGNGGSDAAAAEAQSFPDQVVASSLRHRTLAPLVDSLLGHVGISDAGSLNGLTKIVRDVLPSATAGISEEPVPAVIAPKTANLPTTGSEFGDDIALPGAKTAVTPARKKK